MVAIFWASRKGWRLGGRSACDLGLEWRSWFPKVCFLGGAAAKAAHASVRRALRELWNSMMSIARRLDQGAPGVAASILEGLDEMLTVIRLKLPTPLRRSLACTNSIENMMGVRT